MTNPMFANINTEEKVFAKEEVASYKGITIKTIYFLLLTVASAIGITVALWKSEKPGVLALLFPSIIIGFISALIARSIPRLSLVFGSIYAICEGMLLGVISLIGEMYQPGIALAAAVSTIVVFASMLGLFASGVIRNKSKFVSFVISFGMSLIVLTIVMLILSFIPQLSSMFDNLGIIIAIEALFLIYACVGLLVNFIEAQNLVKGGFDKTNEWCCAFGLLISIVYIYVQLLRILLYLYQLFDRR